MTKAMIGQWHYVKHCLRCGTTFHAIRSDAKYCTPYCRKMACKARLRIDHPKSYCEWCGRPFEAHNSRAMYCGAACKQKRYRARKGAGNRAMF